MLVIKVGGGAAIHLEAIARDLATLEEPAVVVHGANARRDELARRLGHPPQTVTSASGVSSVLTDEDALEMLTLAYAGSVNKRFVSLCQQAGVDAIGLSGLDGGLIRGRRNRGIRVVEDGKKRLLRDHSGKPVSANVALLRRLTDDGYTPLVTVPILDEDGRPLNTENDTIVSLLQKELAAERVVQLLEAPGLLEDATDPASVVAELSFREVAERAEAAGGRFKRKLMALATMGEQGCEEILLGDGRGESPLADVLRSPGTRVHGVSDYELDVYGKRGITLVRGKGARLWDDAGREYVDAMSAQGAAILGHAHPAVVDALSRQASTLANVPGAFHHPEKTRYLERLVSRAPEGMARGFLCNSGTEAMEAALKLAKVGTGRSRVVAAKRGFHGRSYGSLSVTFNPKQHALFEPVMDVDFVAYNRSDVLDDALGDDVAALVIELVQGEGGVHVAEPAYVERAAELCRERGVLLVVDEVQTGFGRTGRLFASEHYGLSPDVLCLAKGIAAGFPMGAIVVRDGLEFPPGSHGSTFGGSPLACAVANEVLGVLTAPGFLEGVAAKGAALRDAIERESRGLGLMIGIELDAPVRPHLQALAEEGVLALPAGKKVLRLLPPLVITSEEIEQLGSDGEPGAPRLSSRGPQPTRRAANAAARPASPRRARHPKRVISSSTTPSPRSAPRAPHRARP